ncbi:MAG: hypothetical protein HQ497_11620, partial [SAR86 cluster bacterium]|nr:hypothetical protein [SAR86 cluster bacterium]
MLIEFLGHLRKYRVPVSIREWLDLLAALRGGLVFAEIDQFYFLSRLCLVKDEKYFDRFDQAFSAYFDQLDDWQSVLADAPVQALLAPALLATLEPQSHRQWRELLEEYQRRVHERRLDEVRLQDAKSEAESDAGQSDHSVAFDADDRDKLELNRAEPEGAGEGQGQGQGEGEGEGECEGEGEG